MKIFGYLLHFIEKSSKILTMGIVEWCSIINSRSAVKSSDPACEALKSQTMRARRWALLVFDSGGLSRIGFIMKQISLREWWRWLTIVIGSLIWLASMVTVYFLFTYLPALLMLVLWLIFLAIQIWGPPVRLDRWSRSEDDDQQLEKKKKQGVWSHLWEN